MLESIAIGSITVLMSLIGSYAIIKKSTSDEVLIEKAENIFAELLENEENQKRLYMTGALLGKGLMDGTGLKGSAKGKRGFEGMIMEVIGNWIGSKIAPNTQAEQPQPVFPPLGQHL